MAMHFNRPITVFCLKMQGRSLKKKNLGTYLSNCKFSPPIRQKCSSLTKCMKTRNNVLKIYFKYSMLDTDIFKTLLSVGNLKVNAYNYKLPNF
jgi:hypothetical protein